MAGSRVSALARLQNSREATAGLRVSRPLKSICFLQMFMICSLQQTIGEREIPGMSKLDFWTVFALGTQLVLAAVVQLTILS